MLIPSRIFICRDVFVIDAAGVVLYNILSNPVEALDIWPRLKVHFFDKEYTPIYIAISKYYNKYNSIPSFDDLELTIREENLLLKVSSLKQSETPTDIDNDIAVDALIDQFTQKETLNKISTFVENILLYDSEEIKEKLSVILMDLDEKTERSESIYLMNDIYIIDEQETHNRISLGLNNWLDARDGGVPLTELVMFGGHRGSGKSVISCNIAANQFEQGNACLYFSIEMRYREIFNRLISILSGVHNSKLSKGECDIDDYMKIANVRSKMFEDSQEIYENFLEHRNYEQFEKDLISTRKLNKHNQLVIIDNQMLTPIDIDLTIQKFKTKFEDKLKVVIVDYVNQINVPDIYEWKTQIHLSKHLKNMARKHDVVMVTPYQTDKEGVAKLSKGIENAADITAALSPFEEYINIHSTKTRNIKPFSINAPIDWNTLAMSADDAVVVKEEEKPSKKKDQKKEMAKDIPF